MGDDLLGGRYRLDEVLGRGGMATVWRAWDTRLDRPVAVKVLDRDELRDPSVATRFDREARTVARLTHPNIVSVYDVGSHDGAGYIVMELVNGVTVASMLADGPVPIDRAVSIARQTADALGAAHASGIVHRDVKPANIMVTPAGTVKVCDFGIARELQSTAAALTAAHTVVGTVAYMAPEQAASDPVDARTDLYALGCAMYAMLTGDPPFTGDQPIEVLYQQLHDVPPPVRSRRPEVPPALDALVTGLLAKDPASRPSDAAAVRAALDHPHAPVAAGAGPPMARASVPAPVPRRPGDDPAGHPTALSHRGRHVPVPVLATAVLVILLIAAAVVITALLDRQVLAGRTASPPVNQAPATPSTSAPTPSPSPSTAAPSAAVRSTGAPPTSAPPSTTMPAASDPVDAVRTVLQQVVAAGQIDAGPARDLNHRLDDIDHVLADGHVDDARHKIADMRIRLGDLAHDAKLAPAGYTALTQALDTLTAAIPASSASG